MSALNETRLMFLLIKDYGREGIQVCALTDNAYGALVWEGGDSQNAVIEIPVNTAPQIFFGKRTPPQP